MRKNKMMRTAAVLGVATMLTASVISGTFAKYTTSSTGSDSARVAKWGFDKTSAVVLKDLFKTSYTNTGDKTTVNASTKVIAPGTEGSAQFGFTYGGQNDVTVPEVEYTFTVDTADSSISEFIKNNNDILWALDGEEGKQDWVSWDALINKIKGLAGTESVTSDTSSASSTYAPGKLPTAFGTTGQNIHTVYWKWDFNKDATKDQKYWVKDNEVKKTSTENYTAMTQDEYDTYMGNKANLDDVTLKIAITATQVD